MADKNTSLAIRPMGGLAAAITARLYSPPSNKVGGLKSISLWSPLQPITPMAPAGSEPFAFQITQGQNLFNTPRANLEYSAADLRGFSRYILARMCIENQKDVLSTMLPWRVRAIAQPGETRKALEAREAKDETLKSITRLFKWPNPDEDYEKFTRRLLEDMLTIDAASMLIRRKGDKIIELRAIDGASIFQIIDENGYVPQGNDPAYQQLWFGLPAVNLTTTQLLYLVRNPQQYGFRYYYGLSPTEQGVQEIILGQNWYAWFTASYDTGTLPSGLQIVPKGTTPDQLRDRQKFIYANLAGQFAKRSGNIQLWQGFTDDGKDQFIFPKPEVYPNDWFAQHVRNLAFLYGVSPQRLMKMIRTEGQASQDAAIEEGSLPFAKWMVSFRNRLIRLMGFEEQYEFVIEPQRDTDVAIQSAADASDIGAGIATRNEAREKRGLDKSSDPQADALTVTVGKTVMLLSQVGEEPAQGDGDDGGDADDPEPEPASGQRGGKGKTRKRMRKSEHRINPRVLHADSTAAKSRIETALRKVFEEQKSAATKKAREILKARKVKKGDKDDAEKAAAEIYAALAVEWPQLTPEAGAALKSAILAGVSEGIAQVGFANAAAISGINTQAAEWAEKRAAEMVGMKRDVEGELVENPNAKWAISDTTRDDLRELIADAFKKETPISELITAIGDAGMFSDARAEMIAHTEVARAQTEGNYRVWKKAGVKEVKWLVDGDPCPICLLNDGETRPIGKTFSSGAVLPGDPHPNCLCILVAVL